MLSAPLFEPLCDCAGKEQSACLLMLSRSNACADQNYFIRSLLQRRMPGSAATDFDLSPAERSSLQVENVRDKAYSGKRSCGRSGDE